MKAFFNFSLILILFLTIFFVNCDRATGPDPNGYVMKGYRLITELPCYVNIMFQVTDMSGRGVTDLTTDDFDIFEDGGSISPTESIPLIQPVDQRPYKLLTVLMLDNSASVAANLSEIKNAALSLINNIMEQQEFAIYVFSENPVMIQDFTDDISELTDAINSIEVGAPTTDLYGAVIEGVSKWTDRYKLGEIRQGYMIMLTDGSDTQASHTLEQALNARADNGSNSDEKQVYTIGLGNEIEPDTLKIIGNAGSYAISSVSEVAGKFQEIQEMMVTLANSFYWLYYMSPTRGNYQHTLRLEVKSNANNGDDSFITGSFSSTGFYTATPGIYVNVSDSDQLGIDTVNIVYNGIIYLEAETFAAVEPPSYVWETNCDSIVLLVLDENNAYASVTGIGGIAEGYTITVTDTVNNYSIELPISENFGPIWSTLTSMPTPRCYLGAVEVNGKIYSIGGYNPGYLSTIEEYTPALDSWTAKASMPIGRAALGVATVNNKIYAIGGVISTTDQNTVEEYNPDTDSWVSKRAMPTSRRHMGVVAVDGKIYVIGGYKGSSLNIVEVYDPANDTWTTKQPMPTSRYLFGVAVINGKIYAIGGYNGSNLNTVEEYDPASDTWTTGTSMPTARYGIGVEVVNNKIYAIGGFYSSPTNIVEEYSPDTDTWTTKTSMLTARHSFGIVVIDDKIYTIGGAAGSEYLNVAEAYAPLRD